MANLDIEKGQIGELQTRHELKCYLDDSVYKTINNLIIPSGIRTSQIDHVVVSKYGIFVIETKYTNYWIYGSPDDEKWTKKFFKKSYQFTNPILQNNVHIETLSKYLKLDISSFFSLVVFWGDCQLKKTLPPYVVKGFDFIKYIKSVKKIVFFNNEENEIYNDLMSINFNTSVALPLGYANSVRKL